MRTTLLPTCAALLLCVLSFGCGGSVPLTSATGTTTNVNNPGNTTNNTVPPTPTASVSLMLSDSAACKAPNGPMAHVYLSIADIKASTSATAPANDPSFVDITPGLSGQPRQVDLMGKANSKCFLASSVGTALQLALGNYQQIRIILTPDSAASVVSQNACGASYANCIVLSDNSLHDLQVGAAATSGVEIPVSQIANGGLTINAGEQPAIDFNFDICSSIVLTSDGGYEFKPVVHVGLVSSSGGNITGTIVSSATGVALNGGTVVVALEQKDASGIDRVLMRTVAGTDGSFVLCPVPQGTYDIVAVGVDGANVAYSAGVETGIQSGQIAGEIPLVPGSRQGTLQGLMSTQNAGLPPAATVGAMQSDALQKIESNGVTITVPLLPTQSPYNEAMLTASAQNCPSGTDCASYSMLLPTTAPNVLACSSQTTSFSQQGTTPGYIAESFAQNSGSGSQDCASSNLRVTTTPNGGNLTLNPGSNTTAANMTYTQCR